MGRGKGMLPSIKFLCIGLFLFISNLSCGGDHITQNNLQLGKVSGSIIEFQASSLSQIESITLGTIDEEIYEFRVEKNLGKFTPSHLRQHMIHGELVEVHYRQYGDEKWLDSIDDVRAR